MCWWKNCNFMEIDVVFGLSILLLTWLCCLAAAVFLRRVPSVRWRWQEAVPLRGLRHLPGRRPRQVLPLRHLRHVPSQRSAGQAQGDDEIQASFPFEEPPRTDLVIVNRPIAQFKCSKACQCKTLRCKCYGFFVNLLAFLCHSFCSYTYC